MPNDRLGIDRSVIKPTVTGAIHIPQAALQEAIEKADRIIPIIRTCVNCLKFDEPKEHCSQFGARPPARVIAYGCPQYENDDIPF